MNAKNAKSFLSLCVHIYQTLKKIYVILISFGLLRGNLENFATSFFYN